MQRPALPFSLPVNKIGTITRFIGLFILGVLAAGFFYLVMFTLTRAISTVPVIAIIIALCFIINRLARKSVISRAEKIWYVE